MKPANEVEPAVELNGLKRRLEALENKKKSADRFGRWLSTVAVAISLVSVTLSGYQHFISRPQLSLQFGDRPKLIAIRMGDSTTTSFLVMTARITNHGDRGTSIFHAELWKSRDKSNDVRSTNGSDTPSKLQATKLPLYIKGGDSVSIRVCFAMYGDTLRDDLLKLSLIDSDGIAHSLDFKPDSVVTVKRIPAL